MQSTHKLRPPPLLQKGKSAEPIPAAAWVSAARLRRDWAAPQQPSTDARRLQKEEKLEALDVFTPAHTKDVKDTHSLHFQLHFLFHFLRTRPSRWRGDTSG